MIAASSQPNSLVLKDEAGIVESVKFTPPQVGSETLIRVVNGVTTQQQAPIDKPFYAAITLAGSSPSEVLTQLGLQKKPDKSVIIEVVQRGADTNVLVRSLYREMREVLEEDRVCVGSIKEGEEIAPYCRAQRSEDIYRREVVKVDKLVTDTERKTYSLKDQPIFTVLVASLVLAQSSEAKELLGFLVQRFPEQAQLAEQQVKARSIQRVEALRSASEATLSELSGFNLSGITAASA